MANTQKLSLVTIKIYDMLGREVETVIDEVPRSRTIFYSCTLLMSVHLKRSLFLSIKSWKLYSNKKNDFIEIILSTN